MGSKSQAPRPAQLVGSHVFKYCVSFFNKNNAINCTSAQKRKSIRIKHGFCMESRWEEQWFCTSTAKNLTNGMALSFKPPCARYTSLSPSNSRCFAHVHYLECQNYRKRKKDNGCMRNLSRKHFQQVVLLLMQVHFNGYWLILSSSNLFLACQIAEKLKPPPIVTSILTKLSGVIPTWKIVPTKNVIDTAFKDPIKREEVQFFTCLSSRHIDGICITV